MQCGKEYHKSDDVLACEEAGKGPTTLMSKKLATCCPSAARSLAMTFIDKIYLLKYLKNIYFMAIPAGNEQSNKCRRLACLTYSNPGIENIAENYGLSNSARYRPFALSLRYLSAGYRVFATSGPEWPPDNHALTPVQDLMVVAGRRWYEASGRLGSLRDMQRRTLTTLGRAHS
jgi:hypothetical protein